MKKYAIWKNHKVIGYVELTEEQRMQFNCIAGIGLYIGFDEIVAPEEYKKKMLNDIKGLYK